MYHLFNDLRGLSLVTSDGAKGTVRDIYFDDSSWDVRFVVVETGAFLFGHEVVIGTGALGKPELESRRWPAKLSKSKLENAPDPEAVETVDEQERRRRAERRARWPMFMLSPSGAAYSPLLVEQQIREIDKIEKAVEKPMAPITTRLRSMAEVCGYDVEASDGQIGTVEDFLINPLEWKVRHVMIDTGDWLPGKQVVLSVDWIEAFRWDEGVVKFGNTMHQIETSPQPADVPGLTRKDEDLLLAHYGGPL